MPVVLHPNVTTPPLDQELWRYSNFTKFVSLVTTRTLWFARADTLGDPFELSLPRWAPAITYNLDNGRLEQMSPEIIDIVARGIRMSRSWLFVNCWFGGDRDSAAMWATFGSSQDGVAVRSSVRRVSDAVLCDKDVYVGKVFYFDYALTDPPPGSDAIAWRNQLSLAYMKRDAFRHEQEIRVVIADNDSKELPGLAVPVDLSNLVTEVTVAPFAEQWFVDLVGLYLAQAGLSIPVGRSTIGDEPNWRFSLQPGFEHLPIARLNPPPLPEE
jgi:hypothetical protein